MRCEVSDVVSPRHDSCRSSVEYVGVGYCLVRFCDFSALCIDTVRA